MRPRLPEIEKKNSKSHKVILKQYSAVNLCVDLEMLLVLICLSYQKILLQEEVKHSLTLLTEQHLLHPESFDQNLYSVLFLFLFLFLFLVLV